MKSIPAALQTQADANPHAPVVLVEVSNWGGSTLRWAGTDADVTYAGNVFDARALEVTNIEHGLNGRPVEITVTLANQDLALTDLIDTSNPCGPDPALITVYRVFLDDLTAAHTLASNLAVESYQVNEETARLRGKGLSALLTKLVPRRRFGRLCAWTFQGDECGLTTAVGTYCSATDAVNGPHEYTDEACQSFNNFENYGGFLFVLPRETGGG